MYMQKGRSPSSPRRFQRPTTLDKNVSLPSSHSSGSDLSTGHPGVAIRTLPLSHSSGSDSSTKARIVVVAVEAHKSLQEEEFAYVFNHLVEQNNCLVVVLICLSRVQSELGVDHRIDTESFAGISSKALDRATKQQFNNVNFFLRKFRENLLDKGVDLDIRVSAGPKSEQILVSAVRALRPHWVVLNRSFSRFQRQLVQDLECNLVLMSKAPKPPKVIRLNSRLLGRVEDHVDDLSSEYAEPPQGSHTSQTPSLTRGVSEAGPGSISVESTVVASEATTSSKTINCFACCWIRDSPRYPPGPTANNTVLYADLAPGHSATNLGKMPERSFTDDLASPSTRGGAKPTASARIWDNFGSSRTSRKSARTIERQIELSFKIPPVDDDPEFDIQF